MKQPTRQDRCATYRARWNTSLAFDIPFQLHSITIFHNLVTKKAELVECGNDAQCAVLMKTIRSHHDRSQVFKDAEQSTKELSVKLAPLGLEVYMNNGDYRHHEKIKCKIRQRQDAPELIFKTSLDAMLFINRIAAVFGNEPVSTHLFGMEIHRNVFVGDGKGGRYWLDESEWLATSAVRAANNAMEERIIAACQGLQREGQGIRVTLKPSLDAKGAKAIDDMYGGAFIFSSDARNALRMIGREGYKPKPLTITLEYRTRLTTGVRWIARVLAPLLENIESVTTE